MQPPRTGSIGSIQVLTIGDGAVMIQALARRALAGVLTMAMRRVRPVAWRALGLTGLAMAATVPLLMPAPVRAGMVFDVFFDYNRFDDLPIGGKPYPDPPFIGSGYLSIDDDLPDGSYLFDGLTNLAFDFAIWSFRWRETDELTYDPSLRVVIYDSGRNFYFLGVSDAGGALSVRNQHWVDLSFEPSWYTPPPNNYYLVLYGPHLMARGTYGAARPPVPAPLPAAGALAAFSWSRRLRRRLSGRPLQRQPQGSGGCQR